MSSKLLWVITKNCKMGIKPLKYLPHLLNVEERDDDDGDDGRGLGLEGLELVRSESGFRLSSAPFALFSNSVTDTHTCHALCVFISPYFRWREISAGNLLNYPLYSYG